MSDPIDVDPCWRCGKARNPGGGWEYNWPIYGSIQIGFHSCLPSHLFVNMEQADQKEKELKSPIVRKVDGQKIHLAWGPKQSDYSLCGDCQEILLSFFGRFFFTETHAKIISEGEPWISAAVKARIKELEKEVKRLKLDVAEAKP